jgi:hypothetical protein
LDVPQREDLTVVCYRWVSGTNLMSHDGDTGLNINARLEVTVFAEDADEAMYVLHLIRLLLGSLRGTMGGEGGVTVAVHKLEGPRQFRDAQSGIMVAQGDFLCGVDESTITDPNAPVGEEDPDGE